ncbi:hypothetical protein DESC_190020 [Desulfosarcina cetonica]|nr:hypothetical protein DESC_190020 [Desulfosarcina cetonica]
MASSGEELPPPGASDGVIVVLVVVVLIAVTETLSPCVIIIVLRGRPVPKAPTGARFDDDLLVNKAECSAILPFTLRFLLWLARLNVIPAICCKANSNGGEPLCRQLC